MSKHKHSVTENPGQLSLAVVGALIAGFSIGALFTARSGKDNREAIKQRVRSLGNRSKLKKDEVAQKASEAKDMMVDSVKEVDSDERDLKDAPDKDLAEK